MSLNRIRIQYYTIEAHPLFSSHHWSFLGNQPED